MKQNPFNGTQSKEGQLLRFIREVRKLSLKDVAAKVQMKALEVDHLENGRRFYTPEEIDLFLAVYQFPKENFNELLGLKILNKQIVNHYFINHKL